MKLALTNSEKECLVSYEDYKEISKYKWRVAKNGYVYSTIAINSKKFSIHSYIMKPDEGFIVDHINRNPLDNRRENLRITSHINGINGQNKSIFKNKTSSKYRGVFFHKLSKRYIARVNRYHIGTFNTELEAAEAYDMYIIHNKSSNKNLEYRILNFPEKINEYVLDTYKPKKQKNNKYIGVSKSNKKYVATICINGEIIRLLLCEDELVCAEAYDNYIVQNNIPKKKLNFPEKYPYYNPNSIIKNISEDIDQFTVKLLLYNKDCLIDKNDYDKIKYYKCSFANGYINIEINNKTYRLARFLMNVTDPKVIVDHIDNNPLNNKKNNLRLSNMLLNGQNKKIMGTYYNKRDKKWISEITYKNNIIFSIRNSNKEIVLRARDLFIMNHTEYHYKCSFQWTKDEIIYWNEIINTVPLRKNKAQKTSKYIGIQRNYNKYYCKVVQNGKIIFKDSSYDEEQLAKNRDLFIINNNLDKEKYKLNFN